MKAVQEGETQRLSGLPAMQAEVVTQTGPGSPAPGLAPHCSSPVAGGG